ncbi:unnamed protein product [Amoebophrya sp. A25]|nr:unnamed protein product [Amoebophrya sp. A25]|eukprot:GSA25T00017643001.1
MFADQMRNVQPGDTATCETPSKIRVLSPSNESIDIRDYLSPKAHTDRKQHPGAAPQADWGVTPEASPNYTVMHGFRLGETKMPSASPGEQQFPAFATPMYSADSPTHTMQLPLPESLSPLPQVEPLPKLTSLHPMTPMPQLTPMQGMPQGMTPHILPMEHLNLNQQLSFQHQQMETPMQQMNSSVSQLNSNKLNTLQQQVQMTPMQQQLTPMMQQQLTPMMQQQQMAGMQHMQPQMEPQMQGLPSELPLQPHCMTPMPQISPMQQLTPHSSDPQMNQLNPPNGSGGQHMMTQPHNGSYSSNMQTMGMSSVQQMTPLQLTSGSMQQLTSSMQSLTPMQPLTSSMQQLTNSMQQMTPLPQAATPLHETSSFPHSLTPLQQLPSTLPSSAQNTPMQFPPLNAARTSVTSLLATPGQNMQSTPARDFNQSLLNIGQNAPQNSADQQSQLAQQPQLALQAAMGSPAPQGQRRVSLQESEICGQQMNFSVLSVNTLPEQPSQMTLQATGMSPVPQHARRISLQESDIQEPTMNFSFLNMLSFPQQQLGGQSGNGGRDAGSPEQPNARRVSLQESDIHGQSMSLSVLSQQHEYFAMPAPNASNNAVEQQQTTNNPQQLPMTTNGNGSVAQQPRTEINIQSSAPTAGNGSLNTTSNAPGGAASSPGAADAPPARASCYVEDPVYWNMHQAQQAWTGASGEERDIYHGTELWNQRHQSQGDTTVNLTQREAAGRHQLVDHQQPATHQHQTVQAQHAQHMGQQQQLGYQQEHASNQQQQQQGQRQHVHQHQTSSHHNHQTQRQEHHGSYQDVSNQGANGASMPQDDAWGTAAWEALEHAYNVHVSNGNVPNARGYTASTTTEPTSTTSTKPKKYSNAAPGFQNTRSLTSSTVEKSAKGKTAGKKGTASKDYGAAEAGQAGAAATRNRSYNGNNNNNPYGSSGTAANWSHSHTKGAHNSITGSKGGQQRYATHHQPHTASYHVTSGSAAAAAATSGSNSAEHTAEPEWPFADDQGYGGYHEWGDRTHSSAYNASAAHYSNYEQQTTATAATNSWGEQAQGSNTSGYSQQYYSTGGATSHETPYVHYEPRDATSWAAIRADLERMYASNSLSTNSAKAYLQGLMKTMDKRQPQVCRVLFGKLLEAIRYMQAVDRSRPRRLPPISAPVHLTLLVRCFESYIYGIGGASKLDTSQDPPWISQIYELYRNLLVKNSHATAAMLKAWGLVGNLRQCSIFIDQYRALEKSQKNEIYAFLIYQSALDAALRHNSQPLEKKIRHYIFTDKIEGVDEYWNRMVKVDPSVPPQVSHPHLYTDGAIEQAV